MVLPQSALKPRVRSNMAIIRGGVRRGLSVKAINSLIELKEGEGIRRVDLLAGVRQVKGIAESGLHVQNIRRDRRPDVNRLAVARTPILRNYSFDMKMSVRNRVTGLVSDRYITIRSDNLLTPEELDGQAQSMWDQGRREEFYNADEEITAIQVVGARRKGV